MIATLLGFLVLLVMNPRIYAEMGYPGYSLTREDWQSINRIKPYGHE